MLRLRMDTVAVSIPGGRTPVPVSVHVSAVLDHEVEPGARLWLVLWRMVDGQHAGKRAAIARRSHIYVIDVC